MNTYPSPNVNTSIIGYLHLLWLEQAVIIMRFFGKSLRMGDNEIETSKKHMNTGTKAAPLPETLELLNEIYRPYNRRLAELLVDNKWFCNKS